MLSLNIAYVQYILENAKYLNSKIVSKKIKRRLKNTNLDLF